MKKLFNIIFIFTVFSFCFASYANASALDDLKKAQSSSKAAAKISEDLDGMTPEEQQHALEQSRRQSSQNFDTKGAVHSGSIAAKTTNTANAPAKTTNNKTGTVKPNTAAAPFRPKLASTVPPVSNNQKANTQTQNQQQTAPKATAAQHSSKQQVNNIQNQPAQKNTAVQTNTAKQQSQQKPKAIPAATNNTLPPVPKAKISAKQRTVDTTSLVQSNSLKEDEAQAAAQQEDKDFQMGYAKEKHVHLKDYQPVRDGSLLITPDQIPEGYEMPQKQAQRIYKWLSSEEMEFYGEEMKNTLEDARERWHAYLDSLKAQQSENEKRLNAGSYAQPSMMPKRRLIDDALENSLLNRVGATSPDSFTVTKIKFRLPKPNLLTPQLKAKAKEAYLKDKQDMEEARKRREKEEQERAAKQAEQDRLAKEWARVCKPEIKNSSSAACAMCCVNPKTKVKGFNPAIHVMTGGYVNSGQECRCTWQGKQLTDYNTRNTSDQACTGYCLAHPEDIKGFDSTKHQMHYGELKKGECKCHWIKKGLDICSRNIAVKSDGACSRCCTARPVNNRYAYGFDPKKHNMWRGYIGMPGDPQRYCACWFEDKPGLEEHKHATITGAYSDALISSPIDPDDVREACDSNKIHTSQVNCTSCCLAKTPIAPKRGYVFDYGFLLNNKCKCHFKNPNPDVCDNEVKLSSDYACLQCCKANPPKNFDPSVSEMDYGRVQGNECRCYWKNIPQSCTYGEFELSAEACQQCVYKSPSTQWECEKCCNYIPRSGLYSAKYYTSSPMAGVSAGCICHYSDGRGYGF